MNDVSFKKGLSTQLPATRSDDTLYFVSDKGQLYIGEHNIGENLNDLTVQNVITAKGLSYKDDSSTETSLSGVGFTVDPSNIPGGWSRNLISVKSYENDDTEGNPSTIRILGAYGGAHVNGKAKLISIYMGGSYNDPWLEMDMSTEEFTFKNTPKVGADLLATTSQLALVPGLGVGAYQTPQNTALSNYGIALGKDSVAGLKVFYYTGIDFVNKQIYLADLTSESSTEERDQQGYLPIVVTTDEQRTNLFINDFPLSPVWEVGDDLGLVNASHYVYQIQVAKVEGNRVTYTGDLEFTDITLKDANEEYLDVDTDSYTIFSMTHPLEGAFLQKNCNMAMGLESKASGSYSFAIGVDTSAYNYGFACGYYTKANYASFACGGGSKALGLWSHAEGGGETLNGVAHYVIAQGRYSHAEGQGSNAIGNASHSQGYLTKANKFASHAEGVKTEANAEASHAEGNSTKTLGNYSHAEGYNTQAGKLDASGNPSAGCSHTEGTGTRALAYASHAEGNGCIVEGQTGHAEGWGTQIFSSAVEGGHAEGRLTKVYSSYAHAEGYGTTAGSEDPSINGTGAHSEGLSTIAQRKASHAGGNGSKALGEQSFAHGFQCETQGSNTTAFGYQAKALAYCAFAGGYQSQTSYAHSFVYGENLIGGAQGQVVFGRFNTSTSDVFVLGAGTGTAAASRKNAMTVSRGGVLKLCSGGSVTIGSTTLDENILQLPAEGSLKIGNKILTATLIQKLVDIVAVGDTTFGA